MIKKIQKFAAKEFLKGFKGARVKAPYGTATLSAKGPYKIVDFSVTIREREYYEEMAEHPSLDYTEFFVFAVIESVKTGVQKTVDFDSMNYMY